MSKNHLQKAIEEKDGVLDTVDREVGSSFEIHVEKSMTVLGLAEVIGRLPIMMKVTRIEEADEYGIVHCLEYKEIR